MKLRRNLLNILAMQRALHLQERHISWELIVSMRASLKELLEMSETKMQDQTKQKVADVFSFVPPRTLNISAFGVSRFIEHIRIHNIISEEVFREILEYGK